MLEIILSPFRRVWLCDPPDSSVHGILQARIVEWVAMPSSRGSSQPRDWIWVSCTAGGFFTIWATRQALFQYHSNLSSSGEKGAVIMGEPAIKLQEREEERGRETRRAWCHLFPPPTVTTSRWQVKGLRSEWSYCWVEWTDLRSDWLLKDSSMMPPFFHL